MLVRLQQLVTTQVRIIVSGHGLLVTVLRMRTVRFVPQQMSVAVGGSNIQAEPAVTVLLGTQVMLGGVVSTTVTVSVQVMKLVQQSSAFQIRLITHGQAPLVPVLLRVTATLVPQQASEAVGGVKFQVEPHWTVMLGAQVMTGGVVSTTLTCRVQLLVWPRQSVAFQVSVIIHGHMLLVTEPVSKGVRAVLQQLS